MKLLKIQEKYLPKESVKGEEKKDTPKKSGTKTLEERFPSLNVQVGMRCCMDDENFFLEMLQMYISGDKRELLKKEIISLWSLMIKLLMLIGQKMKMENLNFL